MILPRGFEDSELTGTPVISVVVLGLMLVAYVMAPSSNVIDDVSSMSQDAFHRYWARHPELSFPPDCDWLADDVDLLEDYAEHARAELAGKLPGEANAKGSQDALEALCAQANQAHGQRGWRRYAVIGGGNAGANWLTHVFIHDSWLMLILHAALFFLMGAPLLEQTWGHAAFAGLLVAAMLWAALLYSLFGTTGELMHGASPLVAFVIGAFVARFWQRRVVFETHFGGTKSRFDAPAWSYIGYFAAKEAFGAFFTDTDQRMFVDLFCLGFGAAVALWLKSSGLEARLPGADPPEPVAAVGGSFAGDLQTAGVGSMTLHTPLGFAEPTDNRGTIWNWEKPRRRTKGDEPVVDDRPMHWQSNEDLRKTRANEPGIEDRSTEDDIDMGGLLGDVAGKGTEMDLSVEAMIADLLPSEAEAFAAESIRGAPAEDLEAPELAMPGSSRPSPVRSAVRATDIAPVRPVTAEERPQRPLRQTDREWQTPVVDGESATPTTVLQGSPIRETAAAKIPVLAQVSETPVATATQPQAPAPTLQPPHAEPAPTPVSPPAAAPGSPTDGERTQHYANAAAAVKSIAESAPTPRGRQRQDRDPTVGETQPEADGVADPLDEEPTQMLEQPPVKLLGGEAGPRAAIDPRAARKQLRQTDPGTAAPPASAAPSPPTRSTEGSPAAASTAEPQVASPLPEVTRAVLHCRVVGRDKSKWMLETADGTEFDVLVADVVSITTGMVQLYRPPGTRARSALLTDLRVRSGDTSSRHIRIPVEAFAFDRLAPGADRRTAWQKLVRELAEASGCQRLPAGNSWPGPPFDGFRDESEFTAVSEPAG